MGRINNQITDFLTNIFGKIRLVKAKNEDHNVFKERYSNFRNFAFLWKDSFEKEATPTDKEIVFSNYFGFGSHIDFIKRLIGKPATAFENNEFNTIILMYIINVHGFKVHFELHFYDQKLFCINYRYLSINDGEKKELVQTLLNKYNISGSLDFGSSIIIDQFGNGLLIEDGKQFSVNYISPNSRVREMANSYLESRKYTG